MTSSLKRIGQIGRLSLALAALALASASISAAEAAPKPDLDAATQMARHFQHEDALYRARQNIRQTRTPAELIALHFKHEDALHGDRASALASASPRSMLPSEVVASKGFDWSDALVGAGSTVGVLLLGAAAMVAIRRSRNRLVQS